MSSEGRPGSDVRTLLNGDFMKRNQWGPNNANWRGAMATLSKKHKRLDRRFGKPKKCSVCGAHDDGRTYDWANLTGNYDDMGDFARMCRSCHWKYDQKVKNFRGAVGGRRPGELHPNAKMSDWMIIEIRKSTESQRFLADKFKTTQANISIIKNGKAWAHVK